MKAKQQEFDVIVRNSPTSMDDWQRAQVAASSELPSLTEEQKEVARRFGLSEEKYKRHYLSLLYGQERTHARGANLGETVREFLRELGPDCQLLAVIWDNEQWVVQIQSHQNIVNVPIPRELADDFLDFGRAGYRDQIKSLILTGAGRKRPARK